MIELRSKQHRGAGLNKDFHSTEGLDKDPESVARTIGDIATIAELF